MENVDFSLKTILFYTQGNNIHITHIPLLLRRSVLHTARMTGFHFSFSVSISAHADCKAMKAASRWRFDRSEKCLNVRL